MHGEAELFPESRKPSRAVGSCLPQRRQRLRGASLLREGGSGTFPLAGGKVGWERWDDCAGRSPNPVLLGVLTMLRKSCLGVLLLLGGLAVPAYGQVKLEWKFKEGDTFWVESTSKTRQTRQAIG